MTVYQLDKSKRALVSVKKDFLTDSTATLSEFLDELERFSVGVDPELEIQLHSSSVGIQAEVVRLETEEEYDQRIAKAKEHAFRVQQDANRSWKKQQLRFAKARKNK